VPHVEASVEVLNTMLAARIHLDSTNQEDGALVVIPGSHRSGKEMPSGDRNATSIDAEMGDVLLIRPLVAHCSASSQPGTMRHRRIVHLEFAANRKLPDGYEWHDFVRGD
jgi:ectoine hydroxylase-related dioxygenase (phytanoyl-CoA dioxygenase family)